MNSTKIYLRYAHFLLCAMLLVSVPTAANELVDPTDKPDKKKKDQKEPIKELSYEWTADISVEEFDTTPEKKIKIFNANDVLVYEDNVASLEDIKEEHLKRCFTNCIYLMNNNNVRYYIMI